VSHDQIQEIAVGVFVIFMMMTVGLDLTMNRVLAVFRHPRALLKGLGINYLLVPAVALSLVHLMDIPPLWAAGLLVGAMAPGGPVGAVLSQHAHGNVALAVSLTVVLNTLNTLVTPLMVWATEAMPVEDGSTLPVLGMIRTIVLFQIIPLSVAMVWRSRWTESAKKVHRILDRATKLVLALAVLGLLLGNLDKIGTLHLPTGLAIFVCTVVGLAAGWATGGAEPETRISLCLTAGIRSMSVALLLVTAWFPEPETITATLAYSGIMFTTTWALTQFMVRRRSATRP